MSYDSGKGVYCIINLVNGKRYVGSTGVGFRERKAQHWHNLRKGKTIERNKHLQYSWNKYGKENFSFEILEYVNVDFNLCESEQYWVNYFNSNDRIFGYNKREIVESNLGMKMPPKTEEFLEWARVNNLGPKNPMYGKTPWNKGKKMPKEFGVKISQALKGKRLSAETCERMKKTKLAMRDNGTLHNVKLNKQIADEIRDKYRTGNYSQQKLADEYGIIQAHVSRIVRNVVWT
tara:strand:+ start:12007 stop:12705 length:699 start_codon:yes stop_codon:yes gene_type:complete